jgi:Putative DNA-binding domain
VLAASKKAAGAVVSETGLVALQRWFVAEITQPETAQLSAAARILPSATLSASQRLAIYHSGYHARLRDCLLDDYPALQHALGAEAFRSACRDYILRFPSRSASLNDFGAHMAAFCAEQAWPHAQFAAELAALEWSLIAVIHAAQGVPLSAAALTTLTPAQFAGARFLPCPSVRLLEHRYPVHAYYDACRRQTAGAFPGEARSFTLLWRQQLTIRREELDMPQARLLRCLLAGQPVESALAAAADSGATSDSIQSAFEKVFGAGLFVAFELPATT